MVKEEKKLLVKPAACGSKEEKDVSGLEVRPPVVVVVGHIDHGKTTLLDRIRQSEIALQESGGITQHIGASQISFKTKDGKTKKITFIDTPGHAAFDKMRARGVKVTDLAILVVAADTGVQEQTKESFNHIKEAKLPFLVAINKVDLPSADPERVKGQLAEIGIIPESYGGDVVVVPVSAKTGIGIDELLEMTSLMAELQELKADPKGDLEGVVIESTLDRRRGPLATVLVKNGTLVIGEEIFAEDTRARVKLMASWLGDRIGQALPGDPVEILGFEGTPKVGALVLRTASKPAEEKEELAHEADFDLKIIVKADVYGSLEAVLGGIPDRAEIIHSGLGEINDSDVFLAQTTGSEIFGFNVKISSAAKRVAKQSGVNLFQSRIIYEIFEEIEKRLKMKIDPLAGKLVVGKAEIIAEFKVDNKRLAGCRVSDGEIIRGQRVLLMREGKLIGESVLTSMRHLKEDIEKVPKDQEFGANFSPQLDFVIGDVIISYKYGQPDADR